MAVAALSKVTYYSSLVELSPTKRSVGGSIPSSISRKGFSHSNRRHFPPDLIGALRQDTY